MIVDVNSIMLSEFISILVSSVLAIIVPVLQFVGYNIAMTEKNKTSLPSISPSLSER